MNRISKIFLLGLAVVALAGFGKIGTTKAAATPGSLIKMNGLSSVYYLGQDGKRYVFPAQNIYFSWYKDFSGVVTISQSELESYPLGANITMRPGTRLVKITTNPKVYAVEPGGNLRAIPDEATAKALYGNNWNKRVSDVADAFFTNYKMGNQLAANEVPAGSLVKNADSAAVYYFDGTNYRSIANEAAFNANRFSFDNVMTISNTITAGGTAITANEFANPDASATGVGVIPGQGTGLTVALSAGTAPATTLIYGQALADLGSFNFTAANDGSVKVTSLKVKRIGVSSDALLSAVYLYDGNNRITDNATVSSNYITFNNPNGLFTVAAGTTKVINVRSNVSSDTTAGSQVGVSIEKASDVTSAATITGSFPMNGNIMSVSSATLASFSMNATTEPSTTAVDAGQDEIAVWKNSVNVGQREVSLERVTLRQIGSISTSDLQNLKFFVDGVQKGSTVQLASDNYVTFDFMSSPIVLNTGNRVLEVRADIIGGSSKNYSFSLQRATDVAVKDSQYNVYVTASGTLPATTGTITVNQGSLTVTKLSDSPTGNVTKDASGVTLAKYEFKAHGESIKVEYLRVAVVESGSETAFTLRNGAVFANGSQIGSSASIPATTDSTLGYVDFSLGSSLIINPGSPVIIEVKADIFDGDGTNDVTENRTLTSRLKTYTNGAQRLTSLGYINVPTADVDGNALTIKIGSVSLSKQVTYGNQNTVIPRNNYKLGAFVLSGNNIEDVNINSFLVNFTGADLWTVSQLSDVYLKYGNKTTSIKSTVSATNNTWSVSEVLSKNDNIVVEVYGNIANFTVAGDDDTMTTAMKVSGTTQGSAQSVDTGAALTGQTVTAKAGSIVSAVDASTPVTSLVSGNKTIDLASYKFTTTNDNYNLTEVVVKFADANAAANLSSVILKDGTTALGSAPVIYDGTIYKATFTGLNSAIVADNSKVLTVSGSLTEITATMGKSGADIKATLDSFKANNSQGTETADTNDRAGNSIYVYKSVPTVTNQTLPDSLLTGGTKTLAKFSVTADGTIGWKKFIFSVDKSVSSTITNVKLYDDSGIEIAGSPVLTTLGSGDDSGTIAFVANNEESISGSKTYVLKASIGGVIASRDYISTNIGSASMAYVAPAAYGTVAGTNATFVWSDQHKAGHDLTTLDWNNNFLVKNIPTDSQTLTAN